MPAPRFPELFGDFLLLSRINEGAMAEVLLAVRLGDRTGRTFVVKRPLLGERPSGRAAQSIAREADVLSAVKARGIVALEAAGEMAGLPYVATEHVRGLPLDQLLARTGPLPPDASRAVAHDLAAALSALHAQGWVHGDIAPSNVVVSDEGEALLLDFGLATRAGVKRADIGGKPGYIAPEAVRGVEARPAEDIYALGVVLAECALGERLFHEASLAEAGARAETQAGTAELAAITAGLAAALKRDPSARPSAEALAGELKRQGVDRSALAAIVEGASSASPASSGATAEGAASAASAASGATAEGAADAATSATSVNEPAREPVDPPPPPRPTPAPPAGAPGSYALTPTAPMLVVTDATSALPPEGAPRLSANGAQTPGGGPPRDGGRNAWRVVAFVLIALLMGAAGVVAGRVSTRARPTSVSLVGSLPRRSQIELDGRTVTRLDAPIPVEPGRHVLTIAAPKGEKREYTFTVRSGEQVILIPFGRGTGALPEQKEERFE